MTLSCLQGRHQRNFLVPAERTHLKGFLVPAGHVPAMHATKT